MFDSAKSRATRKGRAFTISLEDIVIPAVCPIFKTPIVRPSIDRIDSSLGYVKGNVRVVEMRANMLRSNATVAEMELVLEDLRGARLETTLK